MTHEIEVTKGKDKGQRGTAERIPHSPLWSVSLPGQEAVLTTGGWFRVLSPARIEIINCA